MTRVEVVKATEAHLVEVAAHMRPGDRLEVEEADEFGLGPLAVLRASVALSDSARTLLIDDVPAAVFGVTHGHRPWALTAEVVDRHPVAFFKASKRLLADMLRRYPRLEQCVDARYERAVAWLAALGFTIATDPHPCPTLPFYAVSIER